MNYPKHWRLAFLLALFLHFFIWSGMTFLVPLLGSKPTIVAEDAISLEDVPGDDGDGSEDAGNEDTEPEDTPPEPEPEPEPEPPQEEVIQPEEVPDDIEESDDVSPIVADDDNEAIAKLKQEIKEAQSNPNKKISNIVTHKGGPQMGQPPKLVKDYYPPADLVKFKGRVGVFATIGKDGRIVKTKIAVTSGKRSVDELAMVAAKKWLFKPALDSNGEPMEVTRVMSIPFNVENIARQRDERPISGN